MRAVTYTDNPAPGTRIRVTYKAGRYDRSEPFAVAEGIALESTDTHVVFQTGYRRAIHRTRIRTVEETI
jgi:hypothetical protein